MNILVIGSGGREHAIIWALKKSAKCGKIFASPGNGGTGDLAENVLIPINNPEEIVAFCAENEVGLVVIGPEAPLVNGLVDQLVKANIPTFGPSEKAARLEGSKEFTKQICDKYNLPTAAYEAFTNADKACAYIDKMGAPIVVKADGLAAGKGVVVAQTTDEAKEAARDMLLNNKFGDAGSSIVVEECMFGEEISVFALSDGKDVIYFGSAQDHKAVGEGDTGPNTGGMGTYSPAPIMTDSLQKQIMEETIIPAIKGMKGDGTPYTGVLFAGFMVTDKGPRLLEFNVRFGDPETQVLMARLDSDLLDLLYTAATGNLAGKEVRMKDEAALCVVMAANGYPNDYEKGSQINSLKDAEGLEDVIIFHAGTRKDKQGNIVANGGRVLGVTALGQSVKQAQTTAYKAVETIDWPEGFCRKDIGWRAVS